MRRHLLFALAGAAVMLLSAAGPLWRQAQRAAVLSGPASRIMPVKPARLAPLSPAVSQLDSLLRAEAAVAELTAEQCRELAEAAFKKRDTDLLRAVLCRWAALDGAAVYAWMEPLETAAAYPPGFSGLGMFEDVYYSWAAADPHGFAEGMLKASKAVQDSGNGESAFYCAKYLLQYDLLAAIRLGGELGKNSPVGMAISRNDLRPAIRSVGDLEAVGAEILAHPEWLASASAEKPLSLLLALRECWQEMDPDGWDRWAAAHPEAAAKAGNKPVSPGSRFVRAADRKAAATEILHSTAPEQLAEVTAEIVRLWDDTEATGQWLNTLPQGPVRDAAAVAYALEAVKTEPDAAMRWADAVSDQQQRARTQRRVFAAWHDAQPAAAAAWLPRSGWSSAQQQAARDIMTVRP